MASSIGDFDEFTPMYQEPKTRSNRLSTERLKSKYNSKGREAVKKAPLPEQQQRKLTEDEKRADIEARKELVRLQKKAKLKKMREDAEKERQMEIKKKQNLDALNQVFKKRTENFKKKVVETKDTKNTSLCFEEEEEDPKSAVINRLTANPTNQSQDSFKIQHFTGHKLPIRGKTAKTSVVTSVAHSVQSPITKSKPNQDLKKKPVYDQNNGFNGRKSGSKINKKSIKKVISIPSVRIDKKLAKAQKKAFAMDTIQENYDMSDNEHDQYQHNNHHLKDSRAQKIDNANRKVVISKINKPLKNSDKKPSKQIKVKSDKKKAKKGKRTKPKAVKEIDMNKSTNMLLASMGNESYINASYQQDNYQGHLLSDTKQSVQPESDEKTPQVHGEIVYQPNERPDHPSDGKEWDNVEMFSSKKFSAIMAKHKQFTRYQDSIDNDEESYIDFQSNRQGGTGMQVVDILDDEDIVENKTYQNTQNNRIDCQEFPIPDTFDKIRKVEISDKTDVAKSRELKFEDLSSTNKKSVRPSAQREEEIPSESKICEDKIFTTSINLLEFDLLSAEKQDELKEPNSKTQDCRDDSLEKPPSWNFIGSHRENIFEGESTSKKVIIDDFDEFKYDDPPEEDQVENEDNGSLQFQQQSDEEEQNGIFGGSEQNNS